MEKYAKVCARIEEEINTIAMPMVIETEDLYEREEGEEANIVTDSKEEEEVSNEPRSPELETSIPSEPRAQAGWTKKPLTLDDLLQEYLEEDKKIIFNTKEQEFVHWHEKLGPISVLQMRQLSINGLLPKYISKMNPPMWSACIHGKETKVPWKTKGKWNAHQEWLRQRVNVLR